MSFTNKVAIVIGSSSGIGAAIAIEFAKEGAYVVLVGTKQEKLDKITAVIEKIGKKPLIVKADISNEDQAERIIKETVEMFGKIDILVNNAGIYRGASIESDNIMQVYNEVMAVNVRAMFHITHLAVPHLIKTQGNIVNISSVASLMTSSMPGLLTYLVSKAAVDHFTRSIALDLARYNVRVNVVNPGPVKTDIVTNAGFDKNMDDAHWEGLREATALKRMSEPKEMADLVLYLASDKAKGITGSTFVADNGMLIYRK